MDRNYDEVISEILIQLDELEHQIRKANKRMDFTIKRMVKAEERLESADRRMEVFGKQLNDALIAFENFRQEQTEMNRYFLDQIKNLRS